LGKGLRLNLNNEKVLSVVKKTMENDIFARTVAEQGSSQVSCFQLHILRFSIISASNISNFYNVLTD
jgi:hypothetical protein